MYGVWHVRGSVPVEAIKVENEKAAADEEACVDCGTCIEECPEKAISEGA